MDGYDGPMYVRNRGVGRELATVDWPTRPEYYKKAVEYFI